MRALRARFVSIKGEPFQMIDAPEGFWLRVHDLGSELAEEAQARRPSRPAMTLWAGRGSFVGLEAGSQKLMTRCSNWPSL